jgi:hypothetical protein
MKLIDDSRQMNFVIVGMMAAGLWAWSQAASAQMASGSFGGTAGGSSFSGGFGSSSSGGSFGGSSFSGSSGSGSSFSGNFGGSSFSGSSGSGFTGGGFPTSTGSNFRTTTGAGAAATGTTTYTVAPSNAFGTFYYNPLAIGMPGAATTSTSQQNFGRPLYNLVAPTVGAATTGSFGSFITGQTGGVASQGSFSFIPMIGGQTQVAYGAVFNLPRPAPALVMSGRVLNEVRQVLARSSSLPSKGKMRAVADGDTVILQGTASDDHERDLAAALVSLTPGVHQIRNELKVLGMPAMPNVP